MPFPIDRIIPIFQNVVANANGNPALVADCKTNNFSLVTDAAANFKVFVYKSDQELPPDISLSQSSTNEYSEVSYTDQADGTSYGPGNEFNPSAVAVNKNFNIETTAARWIIIAIENYSAGTVLRLVLSSFSNFV